MGVFEILWCQDSFALFKGITCNTVFWFVLKNMQHMENIYIKYIHNFIYLSDGLVQPKCLYSFCSQHAGAFVEGAGTLRQAGKMKMAKQLSNFKMTVLVN